MKIRAGVVFYANTRIYWRGGIGPRPTSLGLGAGMYYVYILKSETNGKLYKGLRKISKDA